MRPAYVPNFVPLPEVFLAGLLDLNWLSVTEARKEYFMSEVRRSYVYGQGEHAREYFSEQYSRDVLDIQQRLNAEQGLDYNVCFLNRYDTQKQQLGWHADDSEHMDHEHPIAVISFGAEREIWWKPKLQTGVVPADQRTKLGNGSLFTMPAGFQREHLHRIPKADREVGVRVSLTFRRYI